MLPVTVSTRSLHVHFGDVMLGRADTASKTLFVTAGENDARGALCVVRAVSDVHASVPALQLHANPLEGEDGAAICCLAVGGRFTALAEPSGNKIMIMDTDSQQPIAQSAESFLVVTALAVSADNKV